MIIAILLIIDDFDLKLSCLYVKLKLNCYKII
jgi:hypothetical protein